MPVSGNSMVIKAPWLVPGIFLLREQVIKCSGQGPLTDGSPISSSASCSRILTINPYSRRRLSYEDATGKKPLHER
jgi:hypothetical protein